jgi:hypothetical protein
MLTRSNRLINIWNDYESPHLSFPCTLRRRVAKALSPPPFELGTAVSAEEHLQFAQVTRYEAVLVVQNAILADTKRPNPKERKLVDASKGVLPRLQPWQCSSRAQELGNATARYGAP